MVKKISLLALAGLIGLPALAAGGGAGTTPDVDDLQRQIEALSRQLDELKSQLDKQAEVDRATGDQLSDLADELDYFDERADEWDLAARFKFFGDFRTRYDYYEADTLFGRTLQNDSLFTNRLRLGMRVKATDYLEFKGRLAMYKAWGMQSPFTDDSGVIWPVFDGNVTRTPIGDSAVYVDRAYLNWNGIGGAPIWFSVGRRPTTDGPPSQIRLGVDELLATPVANFNYAFDGAVFGYGYNWANEALGSGKFRLCYGRGFEDGLLEDNDINDVDFFGFNWDVLRRDRRLFNVQSFMAFNVFNYPNFQDLVVNQTFGEVSGLGTRKNLGNIFHADAVYQDEYRNFNYFIVGGWSQSRPNDNGIFNDVAAMAAMQSGPNTSDENGYSIYTGVRYDIDDIRLKIGAEYNYGSQYWIAFTPGHDDIYQSKLATRGHVFELYSIYDIPAGEAISEYGRAFIRLGYQYYDYSYAGSGDWNLFPYDLGDEADQMKLQMIGLDPVEDAHQIYLTFEAYF